MLTGSCWARREDCDLGSSPKARLARWLRQLPVPCSRFVMSRLKPRSPIWKRYILLLLCDLGWISAPQPSRQSGASMRIGCSAVTGVTVYLHDLAVLLLRQPVM